MERSPLILTKAERIEPSFKTEEEHDLTYPKIFKIAHFRDNHAALSTSGKLYFIALNFPKVVLEEFDCKFTSPLIDLAMTHKSLYLLGSKSEGIELAKYHSVTHYVEHELLKLEKERSNLKK